MYEWIERHEDFAEAKKLGEACHMYHYEGLMIKKAGGTNRNIDLAGCTFPLKTIHHKVYGEKKELDVKQQVTGIVFVEEGES